MNLAQFTRGMSAQERECILRDLEADGYEEEPRFPYEACQHCGSAADFLKVQALDGPRSLQMLWFDDLAGHYHEGHEPGGTYRDLSGEGV